MARAVGNTQHQRCAAAAAVRGCKINEMISTHAQAQLKREWLMRLFLDPHCICMWGVFCAIPLLLLLPLSCSHTAQHTHTTHKAGNLWACLSVCECSGRLRTGVSMQFPLFTFISSSLYGDRFCTVCKLYYINLEFQRLVFQSWKAP